VNTYEPIPLTPDMEWALPTKDSLFAVPASSTAASMRQTVFCRQCPFHILAFVLESNVNGTVMKKYIKQTI